MIESKILGAAVGIQRQGLIDKSDSIELPSISNTLIVGKFRRGRTDRPFKVSLGNYRSLLGYDPLNKDYNAVEDVLKQGVSSVWVRRVGKTGSSPNNGGNGDIPGLSLIPSYPRVYISNKSGSTNNTTAYFSADINGVLYNADKAINLDGSSGIAALDELIYLASDSDSTINVVAVAEDVELVVRLSPSDEQKIYSNKFFHNPFDDNPQQQGIVLPNGDFLFKLYKPASNW